MLFGFGFGFGLKFEIRNPTSTIVGLDSEFDSELSETGKDNITRGVICSYHVRIYCMHCSPEGQRIVASIEDVHGTEL